MDVDTKSLAGDNLLNITLGALTEPRDQAAPRLSRVLGRRRSEGDALLRCFVVGLFAVVWMYHSAAHGLPETVKVYKNSGARQCSTVGVSLDAMARTLAASDIEVISSFCAADNLIRPAACGFDAGLSYVYEIKAQDMQKANALGFDDVGKLHGYKERSCPRLKALP